MTQIDSSQLGCDVHPVHLADNPLRAHRNFRFTVQPDDREDVMAFVKDFKVDHLRKQFSLSLYEIEIDKKLAVREWVSGLFDNPPKTVTFTAYDGFGKPLHVIEYTGLEVVDHLVPYDYSNSDLTTHMVIMRFGEWKKSGRAG